MVGVIAGVAVGAGVIVGVGVGVIVGVIVGILVGIFVGIAVGIMVDAAGLDSTPVDFCRVSVCLFDDLQPVRQNTKRQLKMNRKKASCFFIILQSSMKICYIGYEFNSRFILNCCFLLKGYA
jgi:hypothetical protein